MSPLGLAGTIRSFYPLRRYTLYLALLDSVNDEVLLVVLKVKAKHERQAGSAGALILNQLAHFALRNNTNATRPP